MLNLKKGDVVIAHKCSSCQAEELLGTKLVVEAIEDSEEAGREAYMVDSNDWCWGADEIRFPEPGEIPQELKEE
jgi:hypothetical protein